MADPANLDPNVSAYIPRNDGDLIRADEWNDIQRSARQDIQKNRHRGDESNPDDGIPIGADGIEDNAITREKILNNAINTVKIEDNAITQAKIEDNAITQAKIRDGSDSIVCNFPVLSEIILIEDLNKLTTNGNTVRPAIAGDSAGNLHVVWEVRDAANKVTIWYAKLDKAGNVLVSPGPKLDSATNTNSQASIAADLDGNLQVFWVGRDTSNNRFGIFYAKLDSNGNILTSPQLKIRTDQNASSPGAPQGNRNPDIAVDSAGNLQLVWAGRLANSEPIWYAKLDKNGTFIIPPALKLSSARFNNNPVAVVDSDGRLHVFWSVFSSNLEFTFHARLDANGNIDISHALLRFILDLNRNRVIDAISVRDDEILLVVGKFALDSGAFVNIGFLKVNNAIQFTDSPFPTFHPTMESLASDIDGNFHGVYSFDNNIAHVKLDIEKTPILNASLTDLLTTFRRFNFTL